MPLRKVYMDFGAGMPLDSRVLEQMKSYFLYDFGNPSSSHSDGNIAKQALTSSRDQISKLIGAEKSKEIVFTSGATESNNLAIKGFVLRNRDKGNHIITTAIEHMSAINICKYLQRQGFEVTFIPVDEKGLVKLDEINEAITDKTILISVMYANGEIGTIQPIKEIGKISKEKDIAFHGLAVYT